MKLYTVNGNYPNQDFAFTLTASGIGLAARVHTHSISTITGLADALEEKADSDHTHVCVDTLYGTTPGSGETVVSLAATETGGANHATVSVSDSTVTINYDSPQTGIALGIIEHNPKSEKPMIQVYGGALESTENEDSGFLVMEGNVNA
jgi:hypothetical protein